MTLHLPAARAAEDFARALDGTAEPHVAARYAPLVATATMLREQPAPAPRPAFVTELRSQLMEAAETELAPAPRLVDAATGRPSRTTRLRERHLGAAAAAAVLVASTAGVAAAADGSLPGDTLYPVKRGIEQLQVAMNGNDAARGAEHLRLAGNRLSEVEGLLAADGTAEQIDSTLTAYSEHADEGSRLMFRAYQAEDNAEDIVAVREFTTSQSRQLEEIADLAPPTTAPDFGAVAALLSEIDQQARVLCSDCSGAAAVDPESGVAFGGDDAMTQLIAGPVEHAVRTLRLALPTGLDDDARSAEETARQTTKEPATQSGEPGSTAGTSDSQVPPVKATAPSDPVTKIVTGVTSGLPLTDSVKRLTRPLEAVTDPLVDTVDELLTGTLGSLGQRR